LSDAFFRCARALGINGTENRVKKYLAVISEGCPIRCFSEEDAQETGRIPFLPFVGIGPRRYLDLFSLELSSGRDLERKDSAGKPEALPKNDRPPRVPMTPFSYLEREDKLLEEFSDEILKLQVKSHEG
jgi:hypothetical protein